MTALQTKLYWRAFAAAKAAKEQLQGCPMTAKESEQWRRWLHQEAEAPSSSKAFTNAHFDAFLAVCFAWSHPVSLERQARQIDQPITRYRYVIDSLLDEIVDYCDTHGLTQQAAPYRIGHARESSILYMLRRLSNEFHRTDPTTFAPAIWRKLLTAYDKHHKRTLSGTSIPSIKPTSRPAADRYQRYPSHPYTLVPTTHDDNNPF